jgi:hypothetical protein
MIEFLKTMLEKHFPKKLVAKLLIHYSKLKSNYSNNKLEPGELNGAKFLEIVLRMLQYATDLQHQYTPLTQSLPKIDNLVRDFEQLPKSFDDSIRLHIPRAIKALYGIRSKRGVGHTSDIDANMMDATYVMSVCDWILAELIRLYHDCPADEAQKIVDHLVKRSIPIIYEKNGIKTILHKMKYADATLILLHHEGEKDIPISDLCKWIEHPNVTNFKNEILKELHNNKNIYLDEKRRVCRILPPGSKHVEDVILPQIGE